MKKRNEAGNTNLPRPYTIKELTQVYCVSRHTMANWLKKFENEIGPRVGDSYTVAQVTIIFDKLGWPPEG
jgi:transposase